MNRVVYPDAMAKKKDVKTLVVIGAGIMGRGIAHVSAMGGFTTILNDVSNEILDKARTQIRRDLQKGVEIGKITNKIMEETLSRLDVQADLELAARAAGLVIEAVPEN